MIMKVPNGNAVSSVISEKMCGQTNRQTGQKWYSHRGPVTITRRHISRCG